MRMSPSSNPVTPTMARMSVVLPAPLCPTNPKMSPGMTSSDTPSTARFAPNAFTTSFTIRTGAVTSHVPA